VILLPQANSSRIVLAHRFDFHQRHIRMLQPQT
jgi:hypothetical protein